MIKYTLDSKLKVRIPSDLLTEPPMIVVVNKFDEDGAKQFREDFSKALNTGQGIVPILIDSPGGVVYSFWSMVDTIRSSPVPVATIADGAAGSCGCMLLSFGTEGLRFAGPNATMMMHDAANGGWGKVNEVKASSKECERLNIRLFTAVARNCGKPDNYFLDMMHEHHNADVYMDAEEAKKHNLVNHIRLPSFKVDVKVEYKFE
jgi:ATP-dependent Clp endopeptidase proteolytic subunit ClpP